MKMSHIYVSQQQFLIVRKILEQMKYNVDTLIKHKNIK